jgi:hypothetical protein
MGSAENKALTGEQIHENEIMAFAEPYRPQIGEEWPEYPTRVFGMIGAELARIRGMLANLKTEGGVTQAEVKALRALVERIEADAQEMMSPDKMMEIAGKFLGH